MDVSDGLVGDLAKMMRASGATAAVDAREQSRSRRRRAALVSDEPAMADVIVTGGDDYEILCAVPPEEVEAFQARAAASGRRP